MAPQNAAALPPPGVGVPWANSSKKASKLMFAKDIE
jgi:hypothetical protein